MKYLALCFFFASLNSFATNQADCLRFQANEFLKAKTMDKLMKQENVRITVQKESPAKIEANSLDIYVSASLQGSNCEVISSNEIIAEAEKMRSNYNNHVSSVEVTGKHSVAVAMLPEHCDGMLEDSQIEKQINKCQTRQCKMIYLALSLGEREQLDPRDQEVLRRQEMNPFDDHAFFAPKYPAIKLGKLCKTWAYVQK